MIPVSESIDIPPAAERSVGESGTHALVAPGDFFTIPMPLDGVPPPLELVEQAYVRRVLEHTGGKRMAAAQLLGISYPTFLKRLRELGLDTAEPVPRSSVSATSNGHGAVARAR
jgi:DNA-binding NtrC family response regulator